MNDSSPVISRYSFAGVITMFSGMIVFRKNPIRLFVRV